MPLLGLIHKTSHLHILYFSSSWTRFNRTSGELQVWQTAKAQDPEKLRNTDFSPVPPFTHIRFRHVQEITLKWLKLWDLESGAFYSLYFLLFATVLEGMNYYLPSVDKILKISFKKSWYLLSQTMHQASLVVQRVKHLPTMRETRVWSLGPEDPLEKEMATHSSTLAWKIPWTEKPGRLQPMGSQRVGHDSATSLHFNPVSNHT